MKSDNLLTVRDLAERLGVSVFTARNYISAMGLKPSFLVRLGGTRSIMLFTEDIIPTLVAERGQRLEKKREVGKSVGAENLKRWRNVKSMAPVASKSEVVCEHSFVPYRYSRGIGPMRKGEYELHVLLCTKCWKLFNTWGTVIDDVVGR